MLFSIKYTLLLIYLFEANKRYLDNFDVDDRKSALVHTLITVDSYVNYMHYESKIKALMKIDRCSLMDHQLWSILQIQVNIKTSKVSFGLNQLN